MTTSRRPGRARRATRWLLRWRVLRWLPVVALALLALAQAVPYGRAHGNPQPISEPSWDSPRTRELAVAACFDCHSSLTEWPWYSNVAPASWLIQHDVDEGRAELDFTDWARYATQADEVLEVVQEGEMPPLQYRLLHGGARLSDRERQELLQGLQRTFARGGG